MEVLEQPLLHDTCRLQRDFAILASPLMLLLDLLLFLDFFLGLAQPADQIASISLDQSLEV